MDSEDRPAFGRKIPDWCKRGGKEFLLFFPVIPVSWNLFVGFCTVFGIIETIGPFFRYLINYWKSITREFWNVLFENVFAGFNIDLEDPDKDGLTFCLFFLIFGLSAFPAYYRTLRSASDSPLRKVNWPLFPIASFVSMCMVSIVASSVTDGSVLSREASASAPLQIVVFLVLCAVIYLCVAIIPLFFAYVIAYVSSVFKKHGTFKIIFPLVIFLYAVSWAVLISGHTADINLMSSRTVTVLVTMICLFFPLWMPVAQPEKLIKMLGLFLLIGAIASGSYWLDYVRFQASVPLISVSDADKKDIALLSDSCRKNPNARLLLFLASTAGKGWQQDPMRVCDCLGAQIKTGESDAMVKTLQTDFSKFVEMDSEKQGNYIVACVPF